MTIKELIKNLRYYPSDMEVMLAGEYPVGSKEKAKEINVCDINRTEEDTLVIG